VLYFSPNLIKFHPLIIHVIFLGFFMSENQSLLDNAIAQVVGLVGGTIKQDENVLVSLASSTLSEKLAEVVSACAFVTAYSPRQILEFLDGQEDARLKNLLVTILQDPDIVSKLNPMVKCSVEKAGITRKKSLFETPEIIPDAAIKNNKTFFLVFRPILEIAAKIDDRIRQLESSNSSDMETLLKIIVEPSCTDPNNPSTMQYHLIELAAYLFSYHPQSGRLIESLGENGLELLIAQINNAITVKNNAKDGQDCLYESYEIREILKSKFGPGGQGMV
jgi:hypothetical protein